MNATAPEIAARYDRDGFVFPLDILSAAETGTLRTDPEPAEADLAGQPKRLAMARGYPARLPPSYDALVRHPKMLSAARAALGPDPMVWGSGHFIEDAATARADAVAEDRKRKTT